MFPPVPFRAAALAVGLFLVLPGCSGSKPPGTGGKPDKDKKVEPTPSPDPGKDKKIDPITAVPKPPAKIDLDSGVGKEAMDFLKAVREGSAKADRLSAGFAKSVGLPVLSVEDKSKGFSPTAAEGWLKRVGDSAGFGPALTSHQIGDAAVFRGVLVGGKPGGYSLRMVREGGVWKVDFLGASSANMSGAAVDLGDGDAVAREFAAAAFAELIADKDAMPAEERVYAVAAALTPELRKAWAAPFSSDEKDGYDYNRGALTLKVGEFGGGAEAVATSAVPGQPAFRVEVTKAGAKKAYLLTLAKGTAPGQWLVSGFIAQ